VARKNHVQRPVKISKKERTIFVLLRELPCGHNHGNKGRPKVGQQEKHSLSRKNKLLIQACVPP
jgi:hypothetical protein